MILGCVGDCNGVDAVAVTDVITLVRIGLGAPSRQPVRAEGCRSADRWTLGYSFKPQSMLWTDATASFQGAEPLD